jgi:Cu2+-containing amine oxidase
MPPRSLSNPARPAPTPPNRVPPLPQDGTIQFEAKLTGIVSTAPLYPEEEAAGGEPQHGVLVAPGVVAHHHQHFFCVRMDMALDDPEGGRALSVVEIDAEPMPLGPANPHGVGFVTRETLLETEQQAQRMCAPEKSRAWKVGRWVGGHAEDLVLHPVGDYTLSTVLGGRWYRAAERV